MSYFWAILHWERKVGLITLERMGVEVDALARDVDGALGAACSELREQMGPPTLVTLPSGQRGLVLDFRAPLEPFLMAAEHEARELGHDYVGTEHLLLAAVREADPRLRQVLDRHGLGYEGLRQAVLAALSS